MRLKMGVDGTMVKGKGAVINYALLTEEERLVFDTEMRRILSVRYGDLETESMEDLPSAEEADTLASFDAYRGWEWLTAFWAKPPETIFHWAEAPWSRPDVFNPSVPRQHITTSEPYEEDYYSHFYKQSYTPFLVRLDESPSAAEKAAERLSLIAPGIAAILRREERAVICGTWIFYTTS